MTSRFNMAADYSGALMQRKIDGIARSLNVAYAQGSVYIS